MVVALLLAAEVAAQASFILVASAEAVVLAGAHLEAALAVLAAEASVAAALAAVGSAAQKKTEKIEKIFE